MTKRRPGRPRKYGPIKRLNIALPYKIALEMEREKGSLSWPDFLIELYTFYKTHRRERGTYDYYALVPKDQVARILEDELPHYLKDLVFERG